MVEEVICVDAVCLVVDSVEFQVGVPGIVLWTESIDSCVDVIAQIIDVGGKQAAVELEIETFAHTVAAIEVFADVDVVSCRHGEISEPNTQRSAWT